MKYAKIVGGVVDAISIPQPLQEDGWIEVADDVFAGFIANEDGTFSAPPAQPVDIIYVKEEAARRIFLIADKDKQDNMLAYAIETMLDYGTDSANWPAEQQTMNAEFSAKWNQIKAIRTKSDEIEAMDPIPVDYIDDKYWP